MVSREPRNREMKIKKVEERKESSTDLVEAIRRRSWPERVQ